MLNSGRTFIYRLIASVMPARMYVTRAKLLRWCGAEIGENTSISATTLIHGDGRLVVGDNSWIGFRGCISVHKGGGLFIGKNCMISSGLCVMDSSHEIGSQTCRAGKTYFAPIIIKDGAWLGMNVTVLAGVVIGAGAVVAAGAVVTSDVLDNTMVAGVPAVVKKILD